MKSRLTIDIKLDETAQGVKLFKTIKKIVLNKAELFKLAVFAWEMPKKLKESEYIYLQSKVPAMESFLNDHVSFTDGAIINEAYGDRVKKQVSEYIGIAVGLKYSIKLLKVNPNKFSKIGTPIKGKYLDYSVIVNSKIYDIETKGTVSKNFTSMKDDVLSKKESSKGKKTFLKYGTIALLSDEKHSRKATCIIVDDPPTNETTDEDNSLEIQLRNYATLLSFILDTKYYNRFIRPVLKKEQRKIRISKTKFFGRYAFKGKYFLGECFDYRLIRVDFDNDPIASYSSFQTATEKIGNTKIFIGLEEDLIETINKRNFDELKQYSRKPIYIEEKNLTQYLSEDGVLIVKSTNHSDQQIEDIFPEDVVKERFNLGNSFERKKRHKCGAPCRSKQIEGKPCERLTYRKHCYWHR
ncbi:MAG: hypothetical protein V4580_02070 [Bacteroidota bacterium]